MSTLERVLYSAVVAFLLVAIVAIKQSNAELSNPTPESVATAEAAQ